MTISAQSQHPDHALRENAQQRVHDGTHLAPDAASDALLVQRGSGSLGTGNGALDVQPGTGQVQDVGHTIESVTAVDIRGGDGDPRRDVVYLDDTGALTVREGTPGAFAWDDTLAEADQTITNAYRPSPPDLSSTAGLPLATVTITANAGTLPAGSITELRARAPVPIFDLDANFADGAFGHRRLSSFSSLTDALSYSDTNRVPIYVDGQYDTAETNISVPRFCWLFGNPHTSEIHTTSSAADPLFVYDAATGSARQTVMTGVRFVNDGSVASWCTYASTDSGFITHDSLFRDLYIRGYGGTYAAELTNAYGVKFENVAVRGYANGGFHFHNCNASRLNSLTTFSGGDGATPAVYLDNSTGIGLSDYYGEHPTTDAVIQLGDTTSANITSPYIEQNNGNFDCFIQFGDGGMTAGNTGGSTNPLEECRVEAAKFRNQTATEGMRFYNTRHVSVADSDMSHDSTGTAFVAGDAGTNAGSVQSPQYGDVRVTGTRPTFMANVADLGSGAAGGGNHFQYEPVDPVYTTTPATGDLVDGELARGVGTGPSSENEIFWKEGGVIHRWTASGTI